MFITLYIEIKQKCSKIPLDKVYFTKNGLLFLSQALTHHSFIFSLRFLYELKRKVHFSKSVCQIFHFHFSFVFIKVYIFAQQKVWTL